MPVYHNMQNQRNLMIETRENGQNTAIAACRYIRNVPVQSGMSLLNNQKSHPPPDKKYWKCLNTLKEVFKIDITRWSVLVCLTYSFDSSETKRYER